MKKQNIFNTSIKYTKGVGPKLADVLTKKCIYTTFDLITFFPRTYEDRSKIIKLGEALNIKDANSVILAEVVNITSVSIQYKRKPVLVLTDGTSLFEVVFYSGKFALSLEIGDKIYVTGKFVRGYNGKIQCRLQDIERPSKNPITFGKIVAIYPLTEGLSQKKLRGLIETEIINFQASNAYNIPSSIIKKYRMNTFTNAVTEMHFPKSFDSLKEAHNTIVFEEFLAFQFIHLSESRPNILTKIKRYLSKNILDNTINQLPYSLTLDQETSLTEITNDLMSEKQMFRLLQGDVGSGKTIVAFLAALIPCENNCQVAFLVPTEILAIQHYNTIKKLLKTFGYSEDIKVDLLTASKNASERGYILKRLREGRSHILIGTHSILNDEVMFKSLGLAIVDEEHKFGVLQRNKLLSKGENVDYLLMTATPIPKSLAFTLFGEFDLSTIKTMPKNRKPILTKYKEKYERDHCYKFLKSRIEKNEQGYVVFPLIEADEDKENYITLLSEFDRAKNTYFNNIEIAMIHGKMKDYEKEHIMDEFNLGNIKVLFSTTVIEVGIDNSNATVIIIEGAERFGLSQLHQLRGRVGRGEKAGYCYLALHSDMSETIKTRIDIICNSTDGFEISERDLEIRGAGEFLGTRQSGIPEFKLGNVIKDTEIMKRAKDEMRLILSDEKSKVEFYKNNEAFLERAYYLKQSIDNNNDQNKD